MTKSSAPAELAVDLDNMTDAELADFDAHATAWIGDRPAVRTRAKTAEEKKILVALRLAPTVLEHFRAQGPGWQTRINAVLEAAVRAANNSKSGTARRTVTLKKKSIPRKRAG